MWLSPLDFSGIHSLWILPSQRFLPHVIVQSLTRLFFSVCICNSFLTTISLASTDTHWANSLSWIKTQLMCLLLYDNFIGELYFCTCTISVLVQATSTECHRLGVYKQEKFISHSFGAWQVQDQGTSRFSIRWEYTSQLMDSHFSLCPHTVRWKG